ncbi:phospholipase C, phosphocholine-specific [Ideonella dechloratans]|uniref:phospholipase C n=1 Tax=Ideonella dechloratans TaxID=36863 RepID=A0A643F5T7_IDEDE|nr:phospholipase C, phosphocholine-specific [Ideonella dechloratans]KAB0572848.1 phospholipase C, phosphocholine-specific [Ideonella dechloratans]UFU10347.1 phospholipase C, phosphocholine-specific [Ideonella dechloratans]
MSTVDRRQFLQGAAAAAGTAALPPAIARALAIPAHNVAKSIQDVAHVVILMQENRSFDHYFGTLPGVRGFGDRFTIPLPDGQSVWQQSNGARTVLPYHLDSSAGNAQRAGGTPHSWHDAQFAWDHGRMTHWPLFKTNTSMGYYTEAELPFQFALANAFTVCDAYHCSLTGGTNPNRLFLWTGSNGASAAGVAAVVNEWDGMDAPTTGYTWTAYAERLQAAGVRWKIYQNMPDNFTDNPLAGFVKFRQANLDIGNNADGSPYLPYAAAMDSLNPLGKGIANTMPDGGFLQALRDDIAAGTLPQVSWVVAPATYSEHPGPSCPAQGAWYVEQTLNALTANPAVWSKTVLLVMFDENDGFFDHLPPPAAPSLNRDGSEAGASTCDVSAERFTHPAPAGTSGQPKPDGGVYGLGPRVPMLVLSPWSRGGWVNSQVFDHTSVIRFLESRFGVVETNISAWRRTVAGDLSSAFNFVNPNNEPLPSLPALTKEAVDALRAQQEAMPKVKVPGVDQQTLPVQPAGTRPSRALPYALAADATPDAAGHGLLLDFVNAGDVGAVFHVYDRLHLNRKPRRYTVGAGQRLQGRWDLRASAGRYDLWVLGPNGWHRAFVGSLARRASTPVVEARVAPRPSSGKILQVTLQNLGSVAATVRITALAYRTDGPWLFSVPPGGSVSWNPGLAGSQGWYDLQFTIEQLEGWSRRAAGRLENGQHSVSDPMMGLG